MYRIFFDVVGNPGEVVDCEGVVLTTTSVDVDQADDATTIANAIKTEHDRVYPKAYKMWKRLNEVNQELKNLGL